MIVLGMPDFLGIDPKAAAPGYWQKIGMLFQIWISPFYFGYRRKYRGQQAVFCLTTLLLGGNSVQGDIAAVFTAHVGAAVETAGEQIFQHRQLVHPDLAPGIRVSGLVRIEDQKVFSDLDWELHDLIVQRCQNNYIKSIMQTNTSNMKRYQYLSAEAFNDIEESTRQHLDILALLRSRDPDALAQSLQSHLEWAAAFLSRTS